MSTLKVDTIQDTSSTTYNFVKQVVQTTKTDAFTTTSNNFVDVTGLSVSITPSSSSSKILVLGMIASSGPNSGTMQGKVVRGNTDLIIGDAASNRTRSVFANNTYSQESNIYTMSYVYLDSPSTTSSVTYKVQIRSDSFSSGTCCINRTSYDGDNNAYSRGASTITAMEIAA